jgi:two-component system sensor histidine kinase/response regulator
MSLDASWNQSRPLKAEVEALQELLAEQERCALEQAERLEAAAAALRESEERHRQVVNAAADALITIDERGHVVEFNPAAEQIFGFTRDEMIGSPLTPLIPERFREAHCAGLARFLSSGRRRLPRWTALELPGLTKEGREFPLEVAFSIIVVGAKRFLTGVLRDISERKQAEAALQLAKEAAEAANRLKSDFIATMSHEIRTPMNGVIGMTSLLLETPLSAEQRDYAEAVRNCSESLLVLLNDILDFSKIEAGKFELEETDLHLRAVVEDVLELLAGKAAQKDLELLSAVHPASPLRLRGDAGRLRQVLMNLVGNAIKFTERGEVVTRVRTLEESELSVLLRFEVRDTGIGIPAVVQEKLFQPFTQGDSSTTRQHGGTGLGLAISKRLVELMGGEIGFESAPGAGSTFWFEVRLKKQRRWGGSEAVRRRIVAGKNVLIVDDNATNRAILREQLKIWGLCSLEAKDGEEALSILRQAAERGERIDAAVIDFQMPRMNGLELALRMWEEPALGSIAVVILTSLGIPLDQDAMKKAGVKAWLSKPVRNHRLLEHLTSVLEDSPKPQAPEPAAAGAPRGTPSRPQGSATSPRQLRVLVVEDNQINQRVAVMLLQKLGVRADVASDGTEAVQAVSLVPYDMVFMDCQMPQMDGFDATQAIRGLKLESACGVPVIAMTAAALKGDREKCLAAGMNDYIAKPVRLEDLKRAVERWGRRPAEEETPGAPAASLETDRDTRE